MTTLSTSAPLSQATDADYRAWGSEMNSSLATVGLTQTSDTGQVNWSTATRPVGANVATDYEIWRFNDTLQSTKPVFIKIVYGNNINNVARFDIQVGTGSNGSGTLTGPTTIQCSTSFTGSIASPALACTSRFCYNPTLGFLGVTFKQGLPSSGVNSYQAWGGFIVARSNDTSGASVGRSVTLITGGPAPANYPNASPWMQCINFSSGVVYPPSFTSFGNQGWASMPMSVPSTAEGGDVTCIPITYADPVPALSACLALCNVGEIAVGSTVNLPLVGTTPVTLLSIGTLSAGTQATTNNSQNAQTGFLMLWQ